MKVDLLDYELPSGAIAQRPAEPRESARLLVVGSGPGELHDRQVAEWPSLLPRGAVVVVNDTKVIRARLLGRKPASGGKVELMLVERLGEPDDASRQRWRAFGKGLGALVGKRMVFGSDELFADVERKSDVQGLFEVLLSTSGRSVEQAIVDLGHVPLPPYIRRADDESDAQSYQTVYARVPGAIAAPTAGLHLTSFMLDELARRGVYVATLTLHVGLGTFQPVAADDLDDHPMHAEWMHISEGLADTIREARERKAPVVAVGTTVVRALETAADPEHAGWVRPIEGTTRLLIQPGYDFRVVDALLTNFHLPRSTLLALVAAFAERERVLSAYLEAIRRGYRFYSYGDAMWIPERAGRSGPRDGAAKSDPPTPLPS